MKNVELRDFFKVLLRQLNLSYDVRDNALVISSAERLAQSDSLRESLMTPDAMAEKMKAYRAVIASVRSSRSEVPSNPERIPDPVKTLTLLDLQETSSGEARAQIQSARRRGWYSEGDAFEQFQLLDIDLISRCCTIFDEELGRRYELCLALDE